MVSGPNTAHDPTSLRHRLVRLGHPHLTPQPTDFPQMAGDHGGQQDFNAGPVIRVAADDHRFLVTGTLQAARTGGIALLKPAVRNTAITQAAQRRPAERAKDVGFRLAQLDCHRPPAPLHGPALGRYGIIDRGERFEAKRIGVNPGTSLSLPEHHRRAEHRIVVKGPAEVKFRKDVSLLAGSQSTNIRLARYTACTIPANVNRKCSRCSRAGTSAKRPSCGCRTPRAALAESGRTRERGLMPCSLCTPSAAFSLACKDKSCANIDCCFPPIPMRLTPFERDTLRHRSQIRFASEGLIEHHSSSGQPSSTRCASR